MANTTTLDETLLSSLDGTEYVRLATPGANWKATSQEIADLAFTGAVTLSDLIAADGVLPAVCGGTGGQSGNIVTTSAPLINLVQTWNDGSNTFSAGIINITNTASTGPSYLFQWQLNGSDVFRIWDNGYVEASSGYMQKGVLTGLDFTDSSRLTFLFQGYEQGGCAGGTTGFWTKNIIKFDTSGLGQGTLNWVSDVAIARNAAGVIEVNNGNQIANGGSMATLLFKPPTADPHIVGVLWNNSGTPAISAG